MIRFIDNVGDYFSTTYFDEDFPSKVLDKTGYAREQVGEFNKQISPLSSAYFRFKKLIIEGGLRTRDKILETHNFNTLLLKQLGYEDAETSYERLFHFNENEALPIRHIFYRGENVQLMVMEMQPMIREGEKDPDSLFEQCYNVENEEIQSEAQRYHRKQWQDVFTVPEGVKISPSKINEAVSALFLLKHDRPKYILLLAGNIIFLLEQDKWDRGSYLKFDLEELFTEHQASPSRNIYALFYFLLSKESLAHQSNMVLLDQLDEDSHKSAYEVTKDLKIGIIHAVEALANEALYFKKQVAREDFDETDDRFEQEMKDDCLTLLYRLLFIFYAESRYELDILPTNDHAYVKGYSLEMLRDLEQVPMYSDSSRNGYFFHDSLNSLFHLLWSGYREKENGNNKSFRVRAIDSPHFDDSRLHHLQGVKFRNFVWQEIIRRLSLSREQRNRSRGRISYANLGINQLGSVYESLLAYRGFYAEQDYIEVHKAGKPEEGTYLVPRSRWDDFNDDEILKAEDGEAAILKKGSFVYRLSGRDRQKSASYFTPEVLTRCTVKYTLKPVLERLDNKEIDALELLNLKLLEPAMGVAAFHNEMINQLAEAYLTYRQDELNQRISPNKYREELQKVKAYIATHNVYGVDINPTAVELGKLSLWLNVIHKDMETPFFSNRLGVGNAVVGAWLKAYPSDAFLVELDNRGIPLKRQPTKEWWETAPIKLEIGKKGILRKEKEIYHFLLPDKNMLASAGISMLKSENPEAANRVREWKREWIKPIQKFEFEILQRISGTIDKLLKEYYQFQNHINKQTQTRLQVFGVPAEALQTEIKTYHEKEELADYRNRHNAPYFKLKIIMDYWCALWFWDMRQAGELPTRQQYWQDIADILDLNLAKAAADIRFSRKAGEFSSDTGVQLNMFETVNIQLTLESEKKQIPPETQEETPSEPAEAPTTDAENALFISEAFIRYSSHRDFFDQNHRIRLVQELAVKYRFFHHQLEFLDVFWERGGFDLIAGNPPWVVINIDLGGFLSDIDPICMVRDFDSDQNENLLERILSENEVYKNKYLEDIINVECNKKFVGGIVNYTLIKGQKPNLHKLVIENCLTLSSGIFGIIHDKGIYEDNNGQIFRRTLYKKLEYYFQFQNEYKLFADVGNTKKFEISILNNQKNNIDFYAISNLFHPSTIDQCFINRSTEILGIRDDNNNWEIRGNRSRLININNDTLKIYSELFEPGASFEEATMANIHSVELNTVLLKFNSQKTKLRNINNDIIATIMLDETKAKRDGIVIRRPNYVSDTKFILAAPHFYVGNPLFQDPNENCSSHRDYSFVDLTTITEDFLPRTIYELKVDGESINSDPNYYYVNRKRAIPSNERTLISCIQPPQRVHTIGSYSLHFKDEFKMLSFSAYSFSIVYDFYVRITNREDILFDTISNLPLFESPNPYLINRALMLNCVTLKYDQLWNRYSFLLPEEDCFSSKKINLQEMKFYNKNTTWSFEKALKDDFSRRQALIEIDVIAAMEMKLSWSEFETIYRIQFPVLASNESKIMFDINGREIPTSIKNEYLHDLTLKKVKPEYSDYKTPFDKCDRVEDYRVAWEHFEKIFS